MANVLAIVWFVIGVVVSQTALLVWTALLLPGRVERARRRIETEPVRSFFRGLGVLVVTLVVAGALVRQGRPGPVQLLGWLLTGPMLAGWAAGAAAIARIAADRIRGASSPGAPGFLPLLGGALCTVLGGLAPFVGWFVFGPLIGLISIGAGVPALFGRERREAPARAPEVRQPASELFPPTSAGAAQA